MLAGPDASKARLRVTKDVVFPVPKRGDPSEPAGLLIDVDWIEPCQKLKKTIELRIISIEDKINGKVLLSDGSSFLNPGIGVGATEDPPIVPGQPVPPKPRHLKRVPLELYKRKHFGQEDYVKYPHPNYIMDQLMMAPKCIEIFALGLRDLQKWGFTTITAPSVEFECNGECDETEIISLKKWPNFRKKQKLTLHTYLPTVPQFARQVRRQAAIISALRSSRTG